jgi:hypothetical protein
MEDSEKKIRQEDCNEDSLGSGILTLTNKRVAFDKTRGRIMDFSKKFGETVVNAPLENVTKVWKEGLFMKKVCITIKDENGQKDYKFGVLSNGSWLDTLEKTLEEFKNQ